MRIPRKRLMDNHTLLWALNEIPDTPDLPKKSDVDGPLTIEREKSLSAATDGRLYRRGS